MESADEATVSAARPQVTRIYDDFKDKSGSIKKWIITAACVTFAVIAAALGGLWLYRNNELQQEAMAQQKAQQDSIAAAQAAEQARQDSIAAAEQARQDSIETAHKAIIDGYTSIIKSTKGYRDRYGDYSIGCRFFLYDITGDLTPELWVVDDDVESATPFRVYTYANGSVKKIFSGKSKEATFYKGEDAIIIPEITGLWNDDYMDYPTEFVYYGYSNGKIIKKKRSNSPNNWAQINLYDYGELDKKNLTIIKNMFN